MEKKEEWVQELKEELEKESKKPIPLSRILVAFITTLIQMIRESATGVGILLVIIVIVGIVALFHFW